MNCQDIARLIDSGKFSALSASDKRDADAHAQGCSHCAPLWIMHSSVAGTRPPAMPAELSVRCLTLAAAGRQASSPRRVSRVMMVVGGLVVLAAAASMLMVNVANAPSPQSAEIPITTSPMQVPAADANLPVEAESAKTSDLPVETDASMQRSVPRFPLQRDAEQAFVARQKMALEKLVQLYPELTRVPPEGSMFVAAITLRADGTVLNHAMRNATRETWRQVDEELHSKMPIDGGETLGDFAPKGTQVADGRTLGANLRFRHLTVRNTYDPVRSSVRVEQIMRAQVAELMLPVTDAGGSHVTVLLSTEGVILRKVAGFMTKDEMQQRNNWGPAERAQDMARRLGIDSDQIGLMGSMPVIDIDTRRAMLVDYAWSRQPGESAPEFKQGGGRAFEEGVDLVGALALVERVMPDAFMGVEVERALGTPAVLLTEEGDFVRTGRIKLGTDPDKPVRDAFPGISIASLQTLVLKNAKGESSAVMFIWQRPPAPK
jgi:hypothetical protein